MESGLYSNGTCQLYEDTEIQKALWHGRTTYANNFWWRMGVGKK